MKTFEVCHNPYLGLRAVKWGISWPAFFFAIFWAPSRKLWDVAFMIDLLILGNRKAGAVVDGKCLMTRTGNLMSACWITPGTAFVGTGWHNLPPAPRITPGDDTTVVPVDAEQRPITGMPNP